MAPAHGPQPALGLEVQGLGLGVSGLGFGVRFTGKRVEKSRVCDSGFRVEGSGCRVTELSLDTLSNRVASFELAVHFQVDRLGVW